MLKKYWSALLALSCTVGLMGCAAQLPQAVDQDPYPQDGLHDTAVSMDLDEWVADRVGPPHTDDDDWKSFALSSSGRVEIALTNRSSVSALTVRVYRDDGRTMGTLRGLAGREHALVGDFSAGVYYVEIVTESPADDAVPYVLKVTPL